MINKFSSRRRPFTGVAFTRNAKGVETPKLHQQIWAMGGAFC